MEDIYCRVCGEPWDAYGVFHGDMTEEERDRFLRGEGCPVCKGKGERTPEKEAKFFLSLLDISDATDEDPIDILDETL